MPRPGDHELSMKATHTHLTAARRVKTTAVLRYLYSPKVISLNSPTVIGCMNPPPQEAQIKLPPDSIIPALRSGRGFRPTYAYEICENNIMLWQYRASQTDSPNCTYIYNNHCDKCLQMAATNISCARLT